MKLVYQFAEASEKLMYESHDPKASPRLSVRIWLDYCINVRSVAATSTGFVERGRYLSSRYVHLFNATIYIVNADMPQYGGDLH